jgi:putative hydrolase of the HAD superfamily
VDNISTVIFDIGGVLINIDPEAFPRLLGIDRNRDHHVDEKAIELTAKEYETGQIVTEEFFGKMDKIFKGNYTREELANAWNAIVQEENSTIIPIVEVLQSKYQTAILSNTNLLHFQKSIGTAPSIKKFTKSYLSYQIGASKPDPAIYQFVISDLSVAPSSVLLIDDIAENIAAALKCGMTGIVFKDVSALSSELRLRKIL